MRKHTRIITLILMLSVVFTGILITSDTAYAGKITSIRSAQKLALKKVKKSAVTEVDKDYEKGFLVYKVHLWKGTKEYELTYRAFDGTLLSYGWEEIRINRTSRRKIMSKSVCRNLALQEVPGGEVTSILKRYDGGIYRYKVNVKRGDKKYTLEYHARDKKLLDYKWELKSFKGKNKHGYIGWKKARKTALSQVPGAEAVRVELMKQKGTFAYEVELVRDSYKYKIRVHARTGKILKMEQK